MLVSIIGRRGLASGIKITRAAHRGSHVVLLRPAAVTRIQDLYQRQENGKILKIGLRTRGCSGSSYTMEFVKEKERLDEMVEQDGVKLIIDGRALLSVLGSEIDYVQDKLSAQFVFYNPNVQETCGCGQSFLAPIESPENQK